MNKTRDGWQERMQELSVLISVIRLMSSEERGRKWIGKIA
jgi:hypothetical protein